MLLLLPAIAAAFALSLAIGRYPLPVDDIGHFFLAALGLETMEAERFGLLHNLIVNIRLPRVLAAMLVGASLATSGAAYQAVFRNPLVSPGLLGVLAGASFGAALGLMLSGSWLLTQTLSFAMGLLAVGIGLGIANLFGRASLVMLVLGGIISGALFSSLLSIVKYVADPYNQLPAIVYWLMGSLALADLHQIGWVAIPMLLGMAVLIALGRALDALAMGDDEARSLGVPVTAVRYVVIAAATMVSALTVSIAGMIGWVGLIIPHIARLIVGSGNMRLLPVSACLGAIFLLAADALARTVATTEIPIGIVTELLGIPVFLLVLHRVRRGWT
jgi:iron complex transport system permease protein